MDRPGVDFIRAKDGAYLAFQVFGEGPIDLVWQDDFFAIVDEWWPFQPDRLMYEGMADFSRVILHDRRGIGCSSREGGPANLETRVSDTLEVMEAVGAERPVVGGLLEGGASMALLAATYPERVESLIWARPVPRATPALPDYPWGVTDSYIAREAALSESWGTEAYAEAFTEMNAEAMDGPWSHSDYRSHLARIMRRTCTPDVAQQLNQIWYDTDVRGILPSIKVPTLLLLDQEDSPGSDLDLVPSGRYVSSLMPAAHVEPYVSMNDFDFGMRAMHDSIRRFIGAERRPGVLDSVLATVLFTDIVDSTKRSAELGDRRWTGIRSQHDDIVRNEIDRYRGREVKTMGDGFLVTFDGPARGIECARSIVERVRQLGIEIRAGLHTGEISLEEDGDIAGIAVSIAARVSAIASASEVLVSRTVKDLTAGSDISFDDAGEHELKGVPDHWQLYGVVGP